MKLFTIILAVVILAGMVFSVASCAVASPLEGYTWILTAYSKDMTAKGILPDTEITAVFSNKDNTITGSGGCNTYTGTFTVSGLTLSVSNIISTEKSCGQDIDAQEKDYLSVLGKAQSFNLDHGNLIIHCGQDQLTFRRANASEINITKWGQ